MECFDLAGARRLARAAGAVYLLFFLTAVAGTMFGGQAGVSGVQPGTTPADAARMTHVFLAHQALFEIGLALTLLSTACYLAVTALLYLLLRPVHRSIALVAALFSVMGQAVQTAGTILQVAPLVLLAQNPYPALIGGAPLRSFALLMLYLGGEFAHAGLVFDGLWLILLGYLIFRSALLPRALGALVSLAGLGWEVYLVPPLVAHLEVPVEVLGFAAEAALMVWLLAVGLDVRRWRPAGLGREANVTP